MERDTCCAINYYLNSFVEWFEFWDSVQWHQVEEIKITKKLDWNDMVCYKKGDVIVCVCGWLMGWGGERERGGAFKRRMNRVKYRIAQKHTCYVFFL